MVMASLNWGAPAPAILIQELSYGRPVIVGYRTGSNSGHAVVITSANFTQSYSGPHNSVYCCTRPLAIVGEYTKFRQGRIPRGPFCFADAGLLVYPRAMSLALYMLFYKLIPDG